MQTSETETEVINKIQSEIFFKVADSYNIDMKIFFDNPKNVKRENIETLNNIIRDCKEKFNLQIIDCILIIEQYVTDIKKAIELLNHKNMSELRSELLQKYKIKSVNNSLTKFFKKK
jgi:hypothetical protein